MIDKFIGPGATRAEKNFQLYRPFMFAAGVVGFGIYAKVGWSIWQYVLIGLLAVDMVGGVITNATTAAERWFFHEGQGFKQHMSFIAIHLIQIAAFSWAFQGFDVLWVTGIYGFLLAGSAIILKTPLPIWSGFRQSCSSRS